MVIAGLLLHRPLAREPENVLKYGVGVMMTAFGLFWFGEGIGIEWPYADAAILGLMGVLFAGSAMLLLANVLRTARRESSVAAERRASSPTSARSGRS